MDDGWRRGGGRKVFIERAIDLRAALGEIAAEFLRHDCEELRISNFK
jgi:hypothetical protein